MSPRWWPRRRTAVHRFHCEQHRNACQSASSLLCGGRARYARLRRKPGGKSFVDLGVGGFLANGHPLSQPSAVDAHGGPLAPDNRGRFRVPTLRNVDKRPSPDFVKAYGHNGYFKSLKAIVHFYNTRDVLPRCTPNDPREGTGMLAGARSNGEHEHEQSGASRPLGVRRGRTCELHANVDGRIYVHWSEIIPSSEARSAATALFMRPAAGSCCARNQWQCDNF